jgi:hypothetical protein
VDVLGQGPGAEERGDITEQETEPKRENEQDIDLDDMCSAPDTPKQGEEAHEQAPATPSRDAQNAEADASFDRTPVGQSSPISTSGRVDEAPVHFRSNGVRLYDDDDSEEEEQELIEVRLAPVEPAPLVMDHSIQVEAAEDLAAVITEEGAQEGEEKDLIVFSSSSRPSQFSAATSPTAMPTSQRPQTPHELPASKSVRGEDSPRVVLTEKDRNHSPVDVLLLSKTPGKGMNSNTQMADVADKMRTLTFGAHGRDAASENATVDVDMDVDMSIEVDE